MFRIYEPVPRLAERSIDSEALVIIILYLAITLNTDLELP